MFCERLSGYMRGSSVVPYLGGGVLVAFDAIQCILSRIDSELGRVVATATNVICQRLRAEAIAGRAEVTHKNPWPMFTMGWTGDAAAASLTIDLVPCQSISLPLCVLPSPTRHPGAVLLPAWRGGMGRGEQLLRT